MVLPRARAAVRSLRRETLLARSVALAAMLTILVAAVLARIGG